MMTQPSPSMANRTVPHTPPSFGGPQGMGAGRGVPFEHMNAEILRIDPQTLNELRQELGLGNKEITSMSVDEKVRVVFRRLYTCAYPCCRVDYYNFTNLGNNQVRHALVSRLCQNKLTFLCTGPANASQNRQGRGSKRSSTSPGNEVSSQKSRFLHCL